jgi:hypothetical protein
MRAHPKGFISPVRHSGFTVGSAPVARLGIALIEAPAKPASSTPRRETDGGSFQACASTLPGSYGMTNPTQRSRTVTKRR